MMNLVARDWWQEDDARLLPGEEAGTTVFAVAFQDGCWYFGYTSGSLFGRLCELRGDHLDRGADAFVRDHGQRMAYLVHCVASGLGESCAEKLRDQLMSQAPRDVYLVADTAVTTPDCWLGEEEPEVEVLSFSEWAKTNNYEANGGNPE